MNDSNEITENSRIMIASGTSVPSAAQLAAMLAEIIPTGMMIAMREGDPAQTCSPKTRKPETDIEIWNAAVERRKAERAERRAQR